MTCSAKKGDPEPGAASRRQGGAKPKASPGLDRVIQAQIGDKLRMLYGELADEPVPERLVAILAKLGTKDGDA